MVIPPGGFLLMRHGRTQANEADVICGHTDLPLDARGEAQAREAAEALQDWRIARIFTSPLIRARQTADTIAAATGAAVEVMATLAERNWGAWEGRPRAELRRQEAPAGGESPEVFTARMRGAFAVIDRDTPTLIVAHSGAAREIHALLSASPHGRMGNAEIRLWALGADGGWRCHEIFKPLS